MIPLVIVFALTLCWIFISMRYTPELMDFLSWLVKIARTGRRI